jgi:hypothetical protein
MSSEQTAPRPPRTGQSLILWNEASQKWQDPSNDYWCHQSRGAAGGWDVVARYYFNTPDQKLYNFPTEQQAMEFYVNWLTDRRDARQQAYYERRLQRAVREAPPLAPDAAPVTPA